MPIQNVKLRPKSIGPNHHSVAAQALVGNEHIAQNNNNKN